MNLAACAVLCSLFVNQNPSKKESEDDKLIAVVRKCASAKVSLLEVEKAVKKEALINTAADGDRSAFTYLSIGREEKDKSLPYIEGKYEDLVCWVRPVPSGKRLVGIYRTKDGNHRVFFAVLIERG